MSIVKTAYCVKRSFFLSVLSYIWFEYGDLLLKSLCSVQSKCGKIRTGETPYLDTFLPVLISLCSPSGCKGKMLPFSEIRVAHVKLCYLILCYYHNSGIKLKHFCSHSRARTRINQNPWIKLSCYVNNTAGLFRITVYEFDCNYCEMFTYRSM